MKVSRETVGAMASDMAEVFRNLCTESGRQYAKGCESLPDSDLWDTWHQVHAERAYSDDHPRFSNRRRIFAHNPDHKLYPEDANDSTMTTALRAAWKIARSQF